MNRVFDIFDLAGRVLLAALFLEDGWTVLSSYAGTIGYLEQHSVPGLLLPLALLIQIGGGVLIILGWWTRLASLALGLFCLSTAFIFHGFSADFNEQIHFWKDLALAGGLFMLVAHGAGRYSLDAGSLARTR